MSQPLASHSPDLRHLVDVGYGVEVRSNHLLVSDVPFVTPSGEAARGTLISELSTNGTTTIRPNTHVVYFSGGVPCDKRGAVLTKVVNAQGPVQLGDGLTADCTLSSKPPEGYPDYYEKMTAYVEMISGPAQAIDPSSTAKVFRPILTDEGESAFRYLDSASSRAGIGVITDKLALPKVAIVGLGGTGSYILDLIAKAPINEIHLYDADTFHAHNAFRAPGAASAEELGAALLKVEYHRRIYERMRRGVIAHPIGIDEDNVAELQDMNFVFLSIVAGRAKKLIVEKLEEFGVPFVDCGIGVHRVGEALGGIVSVTTSMPGSRTHVWDNQRISFAEEEEDEYDQNIQVVDLNALNAVLAVIKWKKLLGFYSDLDHEMFSAYTIDGNHLANADHVA